MTAARAAPLSSGLGARRLSPVPVPVLPPRDGTALLPSSSQAGPAAGRPPLGAGCGLCPASRREPPPAAAPSAQPFPPPGEGSEFRPGHPRAGSAPTPLRVPRRPGRQRQPGGIPQLPRPHPAVGAARTPARLPEGKAPKSRDPNRSQRNQL